METISCKSAAMVPTKYIKTLVINIPVFSIETVDDCTIVFTMFTYQKNAITLELSQEQPLSSYCKKTTLKTLEFWKK